MQVALLRKALSPKRLGWEVLPVGWEESGGVWAVIDPHLHVYVCAFLLSHQDLGSGGEPGAGVLYYILSGIVRFYITVHICISLIS